MYVCLCNGFTDRQVRGLATVAEGSAAHIYRALGVRPKCGKCVPMVKEILDEAPNAASSSKLADTAFSR